MRRRPDTRDGDLLGGTLDMLILRTLETGPAHGFAIAQSLARRSDDVLLVEEGSLYPALHRLEDRRWISARWGVSENNRRAKFYRLTAGGRARLGEETAGWNRLADAIALALSATRREI